MLGERSNVKKFQTITDGLISTQESRRFINTVENLKELKSGQLKNLNIEVKSGQKFKRKAKQTIFI